MRKKLLHTMMFVATIATLSFTACTKDNEDLILSKWNVNEAKATIEILNPPADQTNPKGESYQMDFISMFESIEFKKDGICTVTGYAFKEIDTETMQPVFGTTIEESNYEYTINDSDLTVTVAGVIVPIKIENITKNELVVSSKLSVPTNYSPINIEAKMVMKK